MATECLTLSSGEILEYSRIGDPEGYPLLVQHGLIGSAHIAQAWDEQGLKHQLQIFGIARPGYGASTPQPMNNLGQWAGIVKPFIEHLGIKQFDVLGISAGAPYALALANGLPEQVLKVWLFSGVPPVYLPEILACYSEQAQQTYQFYAQAETSAIQTQFQAWAAEQQKLWETQYREISPEMEQIWPAARAWECAGLAREAQLQIRDWGFDPKQIKQPIQLWHAPADDMVPFKAVKSYYQHHPQATLHLQAEESHFPSASTQAAFFEAFKQAHLT